MELIRSGHEGTRAEGFRLLLGPESTPTAIGRPPPHAVEHHSDPSRATYSPTGCTKLPELLTRCVLRVLSCRS